MIGRVFGWMFWGFGALGWAALFAGLVAVGALLYETGYRFEAWGCWVLAVLAGWGLWRHAGRAPA